MTTTDQDILDRLAKLEGQNRRMRCVAAGLALLCGVGAFAGFQAAPRTLAAEEVTAKTIRAREFIVSTERGMVKIDRHGLTITAPA
jgi:hypothetical protein